MHGKLFESKIESKKEGFEDCDRNGAFADTNSQYVELKKRIDRLENYTYLYNTILNPKYHYLSIRNKVITAYIAFVI